MSEGFVPLDAPAEARMGPTRERTGTSPSGDKKSRPRFPLEKHEHYVEELWVSRRLFETHDFGPVVVDPCAGFGGIVMSAMAMGLRAWGCDLVARAPGIVGGRDFLSPRWRAPRALGRFAIVCNPPFGGRKPLIREFAQTALARADKVALLVPVGRLAAAGVWLETLPLIEIAHVSPRSSLWPGRIYAQRLAAGLPLKNGFADVVWLIFDATATPRPVAPTTTWLRRDA